MPSTKELRYFLFSQQLADGVRTTAGILLPAFILNQFGLLSIGFAISLGAMCVSIPDAPGPIVHRKNSMLIATALTFLVAIITSFLRTNVYTLGLEIVLFTFLFSLLQVYGPRAMSVGNAAILMLVLVTPHT